MARFQRQLQPSADGYELTIPQEEIDRLGLVEGPFVLVRLTGMIDSRTVSSANLQNTVDEL
jgi:hypothetical protein